MNFLFIDTECSMCNKENVRLCSFGYVLADENLNIIKQEDLLMNPLLFDDNILNNVICYTKEELEKHKEFDSYYLYIKKLLTDKNNLVIGQSITSDAKYINDACKNYNLEPLEYALYDFAAIYQNAFNNLEYKSLEKEGEELDCLHHQGDRHTSLNDAILTYECFKSLANKLNLKYISMLKRYRGYVGLAKNYEVLVLPEFKHVLNNMSKGSTNRKRFEVFIKNVNRQNKDSDILLNKKINISYDFEKENYREMIYIAQLIKNCGGEYEVSPLQADYYISSNGVHNYKRLNIKQYEKVIFISEFLDLIGFNKACVYNYYDYAIKYDLLLTSEEKKIKKFVKEYGLNRIKRAKTFSHM